MATAVRSATKLDLDPEQIEATLRPVERATMLPPAAFVEPSVLEWELENVFGGWVCMGHVASVSEPGAYLMREIGASSVFAIGGRDGEPRAFLNVCRHRGARLITEAEGSVRKRIQCPYHAWSYDLEGSLVAAPHMDEVEDFDRSCNGLIEVRSAVVGGLLLIDLSGVAPDPADHVGDLAPMLERYRLGELRLGRGTVYDVAANWKGIAENYNECLHCPGVHPELNALSDYRSGDSVQGSGSWCGGSMTLSDHAETMGTGDGHASTRPPIRGLTDARHRLGLLLRPVPQRPGLAPSRLRDAAHALAAGRRPHGGDVRVVLRAGDDGRRGLRPLATRSSSGTPSTARTGASAS